MRKIFTSVWRLKLAPNILSATLVHAVTQACVLATSILEEYCYGTRITLLSCLNN